MRFAGVLAREYLLVDGWSLPAELAGDLSERAIE
jgi:hypothetical protein